MGGAKSFSHMSPRHLVDTRTPRRQEDTGFTRGHLVDTRTPDRHPEASPALTGVTSLKPGRAGTGGAARTLVRPRPISLPPSPRTTTFLTGRLEPHCNKSATGLSLRRRDGVTKGGGKPLRDTETKGGFSVSKPSKPSRDTRAACRGHETDTLVPTTPNLIRFMNAQHGATITASRGTHEHAAHRAHDSAPLNPATPADRPRDSCAYRRRTAEGASARATQRVQSVTCVPVEHTTEGVLLKTQRRTGPGMVPRGGRTNRLELTSITPHAYRLIGDEQPKVLRHARCSGTRSGAPALRPATYSRRCSGTRSAPALRPATNSRRCSGTRSGAPALRPATYSRRCFGTRGAPAREVVLRHCDRRRTAEGASAREVLRHARCSGTRSGAPALQPATYSRRCFGTRGASAREVLRHAKWCSGTATGDVQPKVLRHARSFGTRGAPAREVVLRHCDRRRTAEVAPAREAVLQHKRDAGPRDDDGRRSWKAMDTQRPGHQVEVFLRQIAGFLNTTGLLKAQAARPLS